MLVVAVILGIQVAVAAGFILWIYKALPQDRLERYTAWTKLSCVMPLSRGWEEQVATEDRAILQRLRNGFFVMYVFAAITIGLQIFLLYTL